MRYRNWLLFSVLIWTWAIGGIAEAATVTVTGTVIDEKSQQPIAGAKVELSNANAGTGYFIGHTDMEGHFSFDHVRAEVPYDLGVFADGYSPYEMQGWYIPANQEAVDLKVSLILGAQLHGQVFASDGATPIQNAQVDLTFDRGEYPVLFQTQTVYTDPTGSFQFTQLPPNVYTLNVSKGGFISERLVGIRPQGEEAKRYSINLYHPASVQGAVLLAMDHSPLSGIEMMARGVSQEVGTSDANGFYSIENLKPGAYKLFSQPAGFNAYSSTEPITIREGENLKLADVIMQPLPPALALSTNQDVFLPDEEMTFRVRTFRIGQYQNTIYRVPVEILTNREADPAALESNFDLTPLSIARQWTEEVETSNPYVWVSRNVKIKERLEPGAYVYQISSPPDQVAQRVIFFVTELGIITKRGETKTFVYATDLRTGMPVAGAKIFIQPKKDRAPSSKRLNPNWTGTLNEALEEEASWTGETNEQGIFVLEHALNRSADAIAVSPKGHLAVSPLYRSSYVASDQIRAFVYTDRPVYRPNQEISYKTILRNNPAGGYTLAASEALTITVRDPQGQNVINEEHTTNPWGSLHGQFTLPANTPLGRYELGVQKGESRESTYFFVEEYRKPEFKVSIEPERPYYINGETLRFAVRAEYYFGAPVAQARVRYRFYETLVTSGDTHYFPQSYSQYLSGGQSDTDAEGSMRVEFTPRRSSVDRKITLEVEVEESSGRRVNEQAAVPVGVGEYYLEAKSRASVYESGTPIQIEVRALNHEDKPVSAEVQVAFMQEVWSAVRRKYVRPSRPFAQFTATTDAKGQALVEWLPETDLNGQLEAVITSTDAQGNPITTSIHFWRMSSEFGSYDYQYPTLEGILDKDAYAPGQEATLLLNTQYPEYPIILTVEGRDLYTYQVIWPTAKTMKIKLPILESYSPNVFIGLFMPRGQRLSTRTISLSVPLPRGEMKVEVVPDREKYKPGEKGTLQVKTHAADGSPLSAEVSVAVVDEAIFAIHSDHTPDIHQIFYGEQPNWVSTSYSYPIQYYGGADKGIRANLRKDFRDTALWLPDVYTDANGEAMVEVPYPDNLTSWRITARGHTRNTEVGWTKTNTRVTKELIANLSLPRFFTEGDEVQIPATVHNLTENNLPEIQTRLTAEGGVRVLDGTEKITRAAAGAMARDLWKLAVSADAPEAVLVLEATGREDQDALELRTPVLPLGYSEEMHLTQAMQESNETLAFSLDPSILTARSKFTLTYAPSLAAVVLSSLPYLTEYSYGCTEQTINRFLPMILVRDQLSKLNLVQYSDEEKNQLAEQVNRNLSRIYPYQSWDGGWTWYGGENSDAYLTAFVVYALGITKELGYTIDEDRLTRGLDYLAGQIYQQRDLDTMAYFLYVLQQQGRAPDVLAEEIYSNRQGLEAMGLAFGTLALKRMNRTEPAGEMFNLLRSKLVAVSENERAWDTDPNRYFTWNGTEVETTAWGLMAMVEMNSSDSEIPRIVTWLMNQRRGSHWNSTRDTSTAVMALRSVLGTEAIPEDLTAEEYSIHYNGMNGAAAAQGTLARNQFIQPLVIPIDSASMRPGENTIQLSMNQPLGHWSLDAELFHHGEITEAAPNETLKLTRLYEHAIHTKDYRGRPKILTDNITPNEELEIGKEILVTLVLEASQDLPYLIVEDPLPSGFEVIESFLSRDERGWNPYSRAERRDQKMVFFLDRVPQGETRIEYLIRAELSGTFHANPTSAWSMYYPEIQGRGTTRLLKVK